MKSSHNETNTNEFSIYQEAKKFISQFKAHAESVKEKKDVSPDLWRDDDYQNEYKSVHSATITLKESGLSEEQFYSVTELLESVFRNLSNEDLQVTWRQGSQDAELNVKYNKYWLQNQTASISKIDFKQMHQKLDTLVNILSSNDWKPIGNEMVIEFKGKNAEKESKDLHWKFHYFEKSCKELDKEFNLQMEYPNKPIIKVNKKRFEQMRSYFFGSPICKEDNSRALSSSAKIHSALKSIDKITLEKNQMTITPDAKEINQVVKPMNSDEMSDCEVLQNRQKLQFKNIINNQALNCSPPGGPNIINISGGAPGGPSFN